jgi:DNA segregation ATPase FtsK/SpoIIIE, S-DNA-T family
VSTTVFNRPPLRPGPELPRGQIELQEPPSLPETAGAHGATLLMYLPMAAGSAAMALMFAQPGSHPVNYLSGGLMAASSLGMMIGMFGRTGTDRVRKLRGERRDYMRYLGQMRRRARRAMTEQREAMTWAYPDPAGLINLVMSRRLWERRASSEAFAAVRIGTGEQRLALQLNPPQSKPVEDLEPLCAGALRRFVRAYATVPDLPTVVFIRAFARILLAGEPEAVRGMARAMLAQLAAFHSPDDLRIAVCVSAERRGDWDWMKWLPHAQHRVETDAAGPVRMFADTVGELERLLGEEFTDRPRFEPGAPRTEPHVVVVVDGVSVPAATRFGEGGTRNATVLDLSGALPWKADRTTLRLEVAAGRVQMVGSDRNGKDVTTVVGRPDRLSRVRCGALARLLAPLRLSDAGATGETGPLLEDFELTALLGVPDPAEYRPAALWAARSPWDRLRVPIGVAEDGNPVELDIKESAQGGMGPHGVLIGATGSGKSELLRTLTLALAMTHSSEILNFVLVDFKGGATFAGMEKLPHTSALITNLADELPLVDRMQDALHGELVRRQEYLRQAGYASLADYERARAAGSSHLPAVPTLLVVVDEFSELLHSKREFMDLFVMIGRLGRSLGVHLLLASQRLDESRISLLEGHLSYRIGLRTFSAVESRSILGVADAYELPPSPGNGFLKTSTTSLVRFKAAYVSGRPKAGRVAVRQPQSVVQRQVLPFGPEYQAAQLPAAGELPDAIETAGSAVEQVEQAEQVVDRPQDSLFHLVLERLRDQGPPARQVWLPPLGDAPSLDALLPPLLVHPERGLCVADAASRGRLQVPVGIVDKPFEGVRDLLVANLAGGAGHIGIVGAPQSGKTTLLRTLITGLALTHTPREVQFYCLDFGGGGLAAVADLPHVGGVANRLNADAVTRTLSDISALLMTRERLFAANGIESMEAYRQARRQGCFAEDPFGDVFLVIDGWFTMRQSFEALEEHISNIGNRGLNFGVHLVIAATRWSELRLWLRDVLGTKFELKLGEPSESEIEGRAAASVPNVPGRGLTPDKQHFLAALPRTDGGSGSADLPAASRETVLAIRRSWTGAPTPSVRMLPAKLGAADLPQPPQGEFRVALGLDEQHLAPVWHDFGASPHLMIFGDAETGKTNLLRLVARAIEQKYPARQARIILADSRRDLFSAVSAERQLGYAVNGHSLAEMVGGAATVLRDRLPGADIPPERLPLRDWWQGPELFLLVDDYELMSSGGMDGPLAPLVDLLAQGAEIGLHLVLARSVSGAGRAMMDPVIRRLWELGNSALLLSCPRDEGVFLGDIRPRQLPPGRAQLITRRRLDLLVQTCFVDRGEAASAA